MIKELKSIRGKHTELVSVYVPAGGNLIDSISQLKEEQGTASNIKSKGTRKNVLAALDKIIQHLRLFRATPKNGLVVFSGNASPVEGREDIRLWSLEPAEKLETKVYWCDQVFVLEPLEEMVKEKEVYGLIVLDAREANIALLKGKRIIQLKNLESTVPSKTVKGGMCVDENTLLQLESGDIIPIKELSSDKKILSYSFKDFKPVFNNSFELFKRKAKLSYRLTFQEPANSIVVTPEHKVFVVGINGIEEKSVAELRPGDLLLQTSYLETNNSDDPLIDKSLAQFLGYMTGDGTIDGNSTILYDKDIQLLKVYKKIAEKLIDKEAIIRKRRNSYELRLYKKSFVDFLLSDFRKICRHRRLKDIDSRILKLPLRKLALFLRGLFDAEGYVDKTGVGLRMTNEQIIRKLQLLLIRFEIVASMRGPDKFDRYELRITNPMYIQSFKKAIGFSSLKKEKKLISILKSYRSGKSTRVPISGRFLRKLLEKEGFKKEHFKKYGMFLAGKRNIGYPPFGRFLKEIRRKLKNKDTLRLLENIHKSNTITTVLKEKKELNSIGEFYDLHVPGTNTFVANGLIVHNSQGRYDRLREDAINAFLTKVGETASQTLLQEENLKGIIVGGPGPVKDRFAEKDYLNYQLKNKILGIKDVGYTDEYGLEELVKRSEDLLEKAAIMKERDLMQKFLTELQKGGNVSYGYTETMKALDLNAVDILLVSEAFDWVKVNLRCQNGHYVEKELPKNAIGNQVCETCGKKFEVQSQEELVDAVSEKAVSSGAKVEIISTDTAEGKQFKELGGIGAFLRYKIET